MFEHVIVIAKAIREVYDEEGNIMWGKALEDKIQTPFNHITSSNLGSIFNDWLPPMIVMFPLDAYEKDKYGVNVGVINCMHPHDLSVGEFLAQKRS